MTTDQSPGGAAVHPLGASGAIRRRGPRGDVVVPALLVRTAEEMFGEQTVAAVSMRAVARRAGVTPASVPYHFAAKSDLVAAVVQTRSHRVAAAIATRLRPLATAGTPRQAVELVAAIVEPFVAEIDAEPVRALHWTKVLCELALAGDPIWVQEAAGDPDLVGLFLSAAARVLPHLSTQALAVRSGIAMYSVLTSLAGCDRPAYGQSWSEQGVDDAFVRELVIFTAHGLLAGADST